MKKILSGLLATLTLASCLTIPAFAADGIFPDDAAYAPMVCAVNADQFWQENGDKLLSQDIFQYGERPFREGLMPVLVGDQWNYINEQGQVVDLNRGRFMYVFDFFEGLAAVMDKDTMKVGYIDTTGKLVIPCQYDAYDSMGGVYVGYFHDGKATVFTSGSFVETAYGGFTVKGAQIAEINKSGAKSNARTWGTDDLVGLYLIGDNGYMPDAVEIPVVEEPLDLFIENWSADNERMRYTVTNQSTSHITGYYALLSYWPVTSYYPANEISPFESEYFFGYILPFEIELDPGESLQGEPGDIVSGWPTMTHKWIQFDSKEEYESFLKADALKNPHPGYQVTMEIDTGEAGVQWMRDMFGIQILSGKNN